MKFIDMKWGESAEKFVENFLNIFGDDIHKVFKVREIELNEMILLGMFTRINVLLGLARKQGKNDKKILANVIRIELEILDGRKIKLNFIPLDNEKNPLIGKEKYPFLIFPADEEDIKRENREGRRLGFSTGSLGEEFGLN